MYLGGSGPAQSPGTQQRDAIAGRPDEWAARRGATETNVTAPVPLKGGGARLPGADHVMLTTAPRSYITFCPKRQHQMVQLTPGFTYRGAGLKEASTTTEAVNCQVIVCWRSQIALITKKTPPLYQTPQW